MKTTGELPASWKPDSVTVKGPPAPPQVDRMDLPECDVTDPAMLAAFYGPYGWSEHLRKIALANIREAIRAQYMLTETKVTESRLDDLAHSHGVYVEWITRNLNGRRLYEAEVLNRGLGG